MTGLLIFTGLILIILNILSIKKQNRSFNGALGNAMENIGDDDIRIGELRREFSQSILELQSEMVEMKEILLQNASVYSEDIKGKEDNEKAHVLIENEIIIDERSIINNSTQNSNSNSNSEKVEKIKKLFSEGLSEDEVSEIMHIGKGEVLLIKDLYIR